MVYILHLTARQPICLTVMMPFWLIAGHCLHVESEDISPFPGRLSEQWSEEPTGGLLPLCSTCASQVALNVEATVSPPAANSQSNCCERDRPITALCMKRTTEKKISLSILSSLLFEDCWFFRLHWAWLFYPSTYVLGLFPSLCTCISKPTFFSFIKENNDNFHSQSHGFLYRYGFLKILCVVLMGYLRFSLLFLPPCEQTAFFLPLQISIYPVISWFFFFLHMCGSLQGRGFYGVCSHMHSVYSWISAVCPCRIPASVTVSEVRESKFTFILCCCNQADMRDNLPYFHHIH